MNVHWNLREKLKLRRLTYDVACSRICKTLIDNTFLIIICFWTVNWNDFQIYQNIIWKEIIFIKKINFFQGYSAWLGYIFISIKTTQVIFVYRNNLRRHHVQNEMSVMIIFFERQMLYQQKIIMSNTCTLWSMKIIIKLLFLEYIRI